MRALIGAALLAGCGAAPPPVAEAPPPLVEAPPPQHLVARGLPGAGPYRALVLAGPEVSELELFAVYYGLTATGWRVQIAAPGGPPRGRLGVTIPTDWSIAEVRPDAFDVLFVPEGAPATPESLALVRTFASERHLATTAGGARVLDAAGVLAGRRLAGTDDMVEIDGNLLSAARPGDLPLLVHALGTYAEDRLRQARVSGRGNPP